MIRKQDSHYDMQADNFEKLDGTKPQRDEFVICGSCGKALHLQLLTRHVPPEPTVRRFRDREFAFTLPLVRNEAKDWQPPWSA